MEPSVSDPMAKGTQPGVVPHVPPGQGAQRQLGHEDGPGVVEPLDDSCRLVDCLGLVRLCPPCCLGARHGQQVLGPVRHAVQGTAPRARVQLVVGPAGRRQGPLFGVRNDRVQPVVVPTQALQGQLGQLHTGHLAGTEQVGQFRDGGEGQLLIGRRSVDRGKGDLRPVGRRRDLRKFRPAAARVEGRRRGSCVGQVLCPHRLVLLEVLIQVLNQQLPLLAGEGEPGNRFRGRHVFGRDGGIVLLLGHLRVQGTGKKAAQPDRRAGVQKLASIDRHGMSEADDRS